ncbi:MAG: tRNA (adenosine(37)-N6)-threonylcarbamoyltransferase complex dimerization subunit type 1 TsaB [bacterium]
MKAGGTETSAAKEKGLGAKKLNTENLKAGNLNTERLNILAVDTTSDFLSLAVMKDGAPGDAPYEALGRRMAREILPRIDALLKGAGLKAGDLDLLLVARGPGSFTGTRIGMGVAQTFAQVLEIPLLGVDTLTLLAAQTDPAESRPFHVVLNCARDEVYHARFRWRDGVAEMEGAITLRQLETLAPEIGGAPVMLRRFGREDGRILENETVAKPVINPRGDPDTETRFAALNQVSPCHPRPDGKRLLAVGVPRFLAHREGPWPPVLPLYLKSEAFRTWQERA